MNGMGGGGGGGDGGEGGVGLRGISGRGRALAGLRGGLTPSNPTTHPPPTQSLCRIVEKQDDAAAGDGGPYMTARELLAQQEAQRAARRGEGVGDGTPNGEAAPVSARGSEAGSDDDDDTASLAWSPERRAAEALAAGVVKLWAAPL